METTSQSSAARPGEVWELPLAGEGLLGWAVVHRHPDDPDLLLVVPVDTEPELADGDLAVPVSWAQDGLTFEQRCVLRPDFGAWLSEADLWYRLPGAAVPQAWRDELLDGVLALARGEVRPLDDRGPAPAELEAWREEHLAPALEALEAWRDRRVARVELLDLPEGGHEEVAEPARAWPSAGDPSDLDDLVALPLAAAGEDALDELIAEHERVNGEPIELPELLRELAGGLEGRVARLRLTALEIQLEVDGADEPPRCLFLGPAGGRSFLRWTRHLFGGWRSQPVDLAHLGAPPLRLVVEGERVHDLELDTDLPEAT